MIELLMVIAITSILTLISVSAYRSWQQHVLLLNAVDELKSALNLAQGQAIAAAQNNNWGIHLANDHYIIFYGSFYDENNINNQKRNFNGVQIINLDTALTDGAGGYTPNVVFSKYTGHTPNIGTLILTPRSDNNRIKTISIDANGQVN